MPAYCHQILIHFKPDIIENVKLLNLHILHLRRRKKDQSHIMYPTMLTPSKKDQTAKRLCLTNRNQCLL